MPLRVPTPRHDFMNAGQRFVGPTRNPGPLPPTSLCDESPVAPAVATTLEPEAEAEVEEALRSRRDTPFHVSQAASPSTGGALGAMMGEVGSGNRHRAMALEILEIGDWNRNIELTQPEP